MLWAIWHPLQGMYTTGINTLPQEVANSQFITMLYALIKNNWVYVDCIPIVTTIWMFVIFHDSTKLTMYAASLVATCK